MAKRFLALVSSGNPPRSPEDFGPNQFHSADQHQQLKKPDASVNILTARRLN